MEAKDPPLAGRQTVPTQAARGQQRLTGRMDILYVLPDYFSDRPKPCMNGWCRRYIAVNPVGDVLPCPTAGEINSLRFDNVCNQDLNWIWHHSDAFNRFRGNAWMPNPCQTCDRREIVETGIELGARAGGKRARRARRKWDHRDRPMPQLTDER